MSGKALGPNDPENTDPKQDTGFSLDIPAIRESGTPIIFESVRARRLARSPCHGAAWSAGRDGKPG